MKTFQCPYCRKTLVFDKKVNKMVCQCGFLDRRFGNSTVDPYFERRGIPKSYWEVSRSNNKHLRKGL